MMPETIIKPRVLNRTQSAIYCGGEELLNILEAEYQLRPCIKRNRRLYRWLSDDLDAALEKMKEGEQSRYQAVP